MLTLLIFLKPKSTGKPKLNSRSEIPNWESLVGNSELGFPLIFLKYSIIHHLVVRKVCVCVCGLCCVRSIGRSKDIGVTGDRSFLT